MRNYIRDYIPPAIPSEWTGSRRRFAMMLQEVLDELHEPIREDWLTPNLREMINYGGQKTIRDYSTSPHITGAKWIDGRDIIRVTIVTQLNSGDYYEIEIENIGNVIDYEGFIATDSGNQLPITVKKPSSDGGFRVYTDGVHGTIYATIYYVLSE